MFSKALLILSVISAAFATVYVTAPVASSSYAGGKPAQISWQDNGVAPSLAMFGPAKISIYVGNALQQTSLQLLNGSVDVSTVSSISTTVDSTIGPNSDDYFIRFESLSGKDANGTDYLAFSAKFTLTNMTGTFSAAVQSQIAGQSTAPLAGLMSASSAGPTSSLSITSSASKTPTGTSGTSTPSATKAASGSMSVKAGWAGLVFGALVGVTVL